MRLFLLLLLITPTLADPIADHISPLIQKHCISCHGPKKQKGGIALHEIKDLNSAFKHYRLLENVIDQIESEDMPPDDEEVLPTDAERKKLTESLSKIISRVESGDVPQRAGRVTLRRLNRNEYRNTVQDLFGIDFDPARDFPADGAGGEGFDTFADALFTPPALLEDYLTAARTVINAVYADPKIANRIIFEDPKEDREAPKAARRVLEKLVSDAYRRPATQEDLVLLLASFQNEFQKTKHFRSALRAPLTSILLNPNFLFRPEHDQDDADEWPLNDFEIATRLSYFLWSSTPDRELLEAAKSGKLSNPEFLREQVLRMIQSEKSTALARHFGGQWLGFEKMLSKAQPDAKRFPSFNPKLRKAMYQEPIEFFSHLVRKNRPITDLIESDYTFVNDSLARHYGFPEPDSGTQFQRIPLKDPRRGGVIGMSGILTSTSLSLRTSPVLRGVWILDAMLGDPAPPAPPDAGELPADDTKANGLTFREQLDLHRKATKCASCHARIDPLGFSLENFDAIGRWRTHEANGKPIDASSKLPDGTELGSLQNLKDYLLDHREKFARNITRKLLSYALGRELEYYDEVAITKVIKASAKENYSAQSIILGIVNSRPFLNRSRSR